MGANGLRNTMVFSIFFGGGGCSQEERLLNIYIF